MKKSRHVKVVNKYAKKGPTAENIKELLELAIDLGYPTNSVKLVLENRGYPEMNDE